VTSTSFICITLKSLEATYDDTNFNWTARNWREVQLLHRRGQSPNFDMGPYTYTPKRIIRHMPTIRLLPAQPSEDRRTTRVTVDTLISGNISCRRYYSLQIAAYQMYEINLIARLPDEQITIRCLWWEFSQRLGQAFWGGKRE
jgi:hypothetical protein